MESKGCTVRSIEISPVQPAYKIAEVDYNNVAEDQYHVIYIFTRRFTASDFRDFT